MEGGTETSLHQRRPGKLSSIARSSTSSIDMAAHKFRIGQKVQLVATFFDRHAPAGDYEIVQQLPQSDGEFSYRIKSSNELHQRAVKESQLRRSSDL